VEEPDDLIGLFICKCLFMLILPMRETFSDGFRLF
jgi:hypothetical protein